VCVLGSCQLVLVVGADALVVEQPFDQVPRITDDSLSQRSQEDVAIVTSCPFSDCVLDFVMRVLSVGLVS
jgi:hypothetical protein